MTKMTFEKLNPDAWYEIADENEERRKRGHHTTKCVFIARGVEAVKGYLRAKDVIFIVNSLMKYVENHPNALIAERNVTLFNELPDFDIDKFKKEVLKV